MNPVIFLSILLSFVYGGWAKLDPMVCPSDSSPMLFDVTVNNPCKAKEPTTKTAVFEAETQIYKKNIAKYTTTGFKCWKTKTHLEAMTSFAQHNFFWKPPRHENIFVSEAECRQMVETMHCSAGRLIGTKEKAMTENTKDYPWTKGFLSYAKWESDSYINCFFVAGKVYKKFDDEMGSTLGLVHKCKYEKESCQLDDNSVVYWSVDLNAKKEFLPYKVVEGYLWDNQFLSRNKDIGFTWPRVAKRVAVEQGRWATVSDQGVVILILGSRKIEQNATVHGRRARDVEPSSMIASRMQGFEFRLGSMIDQLNRDLNSFCKELHNSREMDLIHSQSTPTLTARRLLNNTMVHGRLIGSILQVRPCKKIESIVIKKMPGPHCTEGIPVNYTMYGKQFSGYIDPTTLIISKNSPIIDCHLMDEVYFQDSEKAVYVYNRHLGDVTLYRGKIAPLPMHTPEFHGFIDYEAVIHREYSMYSFGEFEGPSANDFFETMTRMDGLLRRFHQLDNMGEFPKGGLRSFVDSVLPFGSFSIDTSRLIFIWQNVCCAYVTLNICWIFLMPRAVKKLMDKMIGEGKTYVTNLYDRVALSRKNIPASQTPTAPALPEEEPLTTTFARMHYSLPPIERGD